MQCVQFLGGLDVVQNDSRGDGGARMTCETEAFERLDAKLAFDQRNGVVAGPDPVVDSGSCSYSVAASVDLGGEVLRRVCGQEKLAWLGFQKLVQGLIVRCRARKFGGAKVACGEVEQRQSRGCAVFVEGG